MKINALLSLQRAVRQRKNSLEKVRDEVSTVDRWSYGRDNQKIVEPQYSVTEVDKIIAELEVFLFASDAAIKQSNAVTDIEFVVDPSSLLRPLV